MNNKLALASQSAFVIGQDVRVVCHPHPAPVGHTGRVVAVGIDYVRIWSESLHASVVSKPSMLEALADSPMQQPDGAMH